MDIRGLILVNTEGAEEQLPLPPFPLALLATAGKTPLQRMADRLQQYGIEPLIVVVESESTGQFPLANAWTVEPSPLREGFWRSAENAFNEMVQSGAEVVVLVNMGSYAE